MVVRDQPSLPFFGNGSTGAFALLAGVCGVKTECVGTLVLLSMPPSMMRPISFRALSLIFMNSRTCLLFLRVYVACCV